MKQSTVLFQLDTSLQLQLFNYQYSICTSSLYQIHIRAPEIFVAERIQKKAPCLEFFGQGL